VDGGDAVVQTTMRYLRSALREEDARVVTEAFEVEDAPELAPENRR
jgi:hypothetical protein